MYKLIYVIIFASTLTFMSCSKYLDVIPDNIATIENAFTLRTQAEKFLFTCYSYLPRDGDINLDIAMTGGDELWIHPNIGNYYFNVARGFQNVVNPYGNGHWGQLYQGIRNCNIFIENIDQVPDLNETDKRRWKAEVTFLKAYYHFYLMRLYGPIVTVHENVAIDATDVKFMRQHVDTTFNYIVQLLDESAPYLPDIINDPAAEMGRITRPVCLSLKAKVLVTAASPLFNGNTDYANFKNIDGSDLFDPTYSADKWTAAADACKEAIDLCHSVGIKLYEFEQSFQQYNLSDTINTQMSIRNAVCERWNSEIIWGNTQTDTDNLQRLATTWLDPLTLDNPRMTGLFSPTLKIAEMFYSANGVPIAEDKTWAYDNRYNLRTSEEKDKLYIKQNYTTAALHFDREPRFYANLGFDGGIWYGQGKYDDDKVSELLHIEAKFKQRNGTIRDNVGTVTGYFIKKVIHYQNVISLTSYSVNSYPWPIIRLADLYLMYAEALNEVSGPGDEVYHYVDQIRSRAGLNSVEDSWSNFSTNPIKFTTQNGMREIIQRERLIELSFEGQRFWDLRRWKIAPDVLNTAIKSWNLSQESVSAYYIPRVVFNQSFGTKDYFLPLSERMLTVNRNLVQNLGWQ
ncbi:RagB/SusD family nutrient uptake outer membrane protein [Parapedobacter sp. 10938]|uniref:RagB/SusD family nutrient uptake outer membrane protein n=1 Tax=Parapedobacter flavus TaxID=3110225 RepID=UPI002DB6ED46|nr:RagB/SusD family nutrient uptake outer membrane protein [Parapedobacter sp. 10938]MEC3879528.1 RagB/SusD family nutrient uptake outer membrane protein [Parapedobacter sp. 10938]